MIRRSAITKYKKYLDADSYSEAVEMAPDDAEVQEGANGGYFYEVEPNVQIQEPGGDGDGSDDDESDDSDPGEPDLGVTAEDADLSHGGYEITELNPDGIGVDLQAEGVSEGDRLYVDHPDESPFIAEVSDVEAGWSSWRVEFADGQFHLDEDTKSTPVGVVTGEPELGEQEDLEEMVPNHYISGYIDEGTVIGWDDPAGYTHYGEVVEYDSSANEFHLTNGESVNTSDADYIVEETEPPEPADPTEEYAITDESEIGVSDVEGAIDFQEELATELVEGDATEVAAYKYQNFASTITDPSLASQAYRAIVEGDGSKTARARLESVLRRMDIDPEEVRPRPTEFNPEEVPDKRKDTVFSDFDSQQAANIGVAVVQNESQLKNTWEQWNDFFNHMTQGEIEEAIEASVTTRKSVDKGLGNPVFLADESVQTMTGGPGSLNQNFGALLSRYEGEGEEGVAFIEEIAEKAEAKANESDYAYLEADDVLRYAATYAHSADVRERIVEKHDISHDWAGIQFDESIPDHDRVEMMANLHTWSTKKIGTTGLRASMLGWRGEDNEKVNGFNNFRPIGAIEPSELVVSSLEANTETIKAALGELSDGESGLFPSHHNAHDLVNSDGTITLYRGVSDKITGFSSVESWSTDLHTASGHFDGQGVMRVEAEPEDILFATKINHSNHSGEEEFTLHGDAISDKWSTHKGDPVDEDALENLLKLLKDEPTAFDGENKFIVAPNSEWVQVALEDDMFDPGMYTEYRFVDGERVPAEELEDDDEDDDDDDEGQDPDAASKIASRAVERVCKSMSKERVYIDDPSEAPDDAQVREGERGGLYYEESGGSAESDPEGSDGTADDGADDPPDVRSREEVRAEVDEIVESAGNPDEAIESRINEACGTLANSLPEFGDEEAAKQYSTAMIRAGEAGLTDFVMTAGSYSGAQREALAAYDFEGKRLGVRAGLTADSLEGSVDRGHSVGETIEYLVLHELGHSEHGRVEELDEIAEMCEGSLATSRDGEWIGGERIDIVDDEVSSYGRSSPTEFVAEVFAGLSLGEEYPEEIMEMYDEYGGPDSWRNYRGEQA